MYDIVDEDLRPSKGQKVKDQWQASKMKQMPRIPRKGQQYRERDGGDSPSQSTSTSVGAEAIADLVDTDDVSKIGRRCDHISHYLL